MKFLKYLLLIILTLVLIFFLIGLLKPSVKYGSEVVADKPVAEAWAVGMDETKYGQWLEGFKSMELLEGEKGAIGSKYKVVVNPGEGQPDFEMIETIEDFKENEYVKLDFDSEMMDFKQKMSFSEKDGKTTIKTESVVEGKGIMMRSMFALMEMLGGSFTAQETKNMEGLRDLINKNTTDYFSKPLETVAEPQVVQ